MYHRNTQRNYFSNYHEFARPFINPFFLKRKKKLHSTSTAIKKPSTSIPKTSTNFNQPTVRHITKSAEFPQQTA